MPSLRCYVRSLQPRETPLARKEVLAAAAVGLPHALEVPPGQWGFPAKPAFRIGQALKKIAAGRLDGLVMAQQEADATLRHLNAHAAFSTAMGGVGESIPSRHR